MSFEWVVPPENLAEAIDEYEKRARVALYASAIAWGMKIQNDARASATWEDRTGNARGGLFFAVDGLGLGSVTGDVSGWRGKMLDDAGGEKVSVETDSNTLMIALSHTVFYGKFLELSNGGRYAVILSTIERNLPDLEKLVQQAYGH